MRATRHGPTGSHIDRTGAESDQHQYDAKFEGHRRLHRHFGAEHDQCGAGRQQGQCVPESLARAEPRRLRTRALAGHERRHRREMVRLERVLHAE